MNPTTFTILLGGALYLTERLQSAVAGGRFIAADGGMRHALALGVVPELWVGDFDSTPDDLKGAFPRVPKQPYPAAKAQTDGEIAIEEAICRGAQRLILAGALGGERSDHALALLLHGVQLAEEGYSVLLTSGEEEAVPLIPGAIELDLPQGSLFSVCGFDVLDGLSIDNARYPLTNFHLPFGASRTISNIAEGPVRLSLSRGRAIVLARPHDFSGA